MEDISFENQISKNSNGWILNNPTNPTTTTRHIVLDGNESNFSHPVHSKDIVVVASKASGLNQESVGNSMVKFNPIVNYDWEHKYYYGNLVVCHVNQIYFAYVLKGSNQGRVRVTNRRTSQRLLLKDFLTKVIDISFSDSERTILACVDALGNIFVYEFFEEEDGKLKEKLLLNCIRPGNNQPCEFHRVIWCSYIGEEDKPSALPDSSGTNDADGPLDDSLLLLVTTNEVAELFHVDLITRALDSVVVTVTDITLGFYVISQHTKPITDAAFSPDATAVATASLDGDIKFFQVDISDTKTPKCIHYWQPHDGKPLSFLHFLDDHKKKNPQAQLWKFVVTGCNENQEIKIWDCQNWSCLQTITFVAPPDVPLNRKEETVRDLDNANKQDVLRPIIKAKFDLSSSFLVLSDINRRVIYILETSINGNEVHVSSVNEFLLTHPCTSFAIIDACLHEDETAASNGDGFQIDQEWSPISVGENNDEEDVEETKLANPFVSIKLFTIHCKALQELYIKFTPKSMVTGTFIDRKEITSSIASVRDFLSDLSPDHPSPTSKINSITPTAHFSPILNAPILSSQATVSPASHHSVLGFQSERQTSSLSSSTNTLPQAPFLLAPDAFVSPRETGRNNLSSSVDYGAEEEEEDEENEVEVRGDVEGADRDMPDGGSRVRSGGGGAGHFFDRGGDGGGDGDSSGASTASQEVTEILESVEDAMGGMDMDHEKNSDDNDVEEDSNFAGSHLRNIDPQPTQLSQPPLLHPQQHMPFIQQQQHSIAHHLPNFPQITLPSLVHRPQVPTSSNSKMPLIGLQHQSMMLLTQSPRPQNLHQPFIHQQNTPVRQSPLNPLLQKWPQAAGIINVDELMRKSEELNNKERRSMEYMTPLSSNVIEADELERSFFSTKDTTTETQPPPIHTLQDLMELAKIQSKEIKIINAKLQQQAQLEVSLRNMSHQLEILSKEVKSLMTSIEHFQTNSQQNVDDERFNELVERLVLKNEEKGVELMQTAIEHTKESLISQVEKIISGEVTGIIVPKLEQSLDGLKEKLSSDVGHKLSSVDNTIKNCMSKLFKSKPVLDSIGQTVSTELRGTLRSIHQDIVVPSFDRGCTNAIQQVNTAFQTGTQQYIKSLETHLTQTRKAVENHKHPSVQQIKSASESMARSEAQQKQVNSQLLTTIQLLQSQIRSNPVNNNNQNTGVDENKLHVILNEHLDRVVGRVRDVVSDKLTGLLRDHQVAIKDQFDAALRSVTPAPSTSSLSDHHQQLRVQVSALLHQGKYNSAFQQALSASDLSLVEFTCENVDCSIVFGDSCLLNQSVLLSLIQQLAADLHTKTELKYRFLDEALVSLDPADPITKEHLNSVIEQLCTNLSNFIVQKPGGLLHGELNKLMKRAMIIHRTHSRGKY